MLMNHIWCNIAHRHLGLSYEESETLIVSKDRWHDFYNNPKFINHRYSNQLLYQFIFRMMPNDLFLPFENDYGHPSKLLQWYEIYMNPFLREKEKLWTMFSKIQRTYHVLLRFVDRVQTKYAKVKVMTDLNMDEIELRQGYSVALFQNQSQYYFTIHDLIKICNSALSYSVQMFPDSYIPKNPYTNQQFTYRALLQIYYAVRRSDSKMPLLLEMFYASKFSIKRFISKYEFFIREEIIKNFVRNGSEEDFCEYIHEILQNASIEKKCKISPGFPRDVMVKALKKYVFLYLISEYSLRSSHKQWQYFHVLRNSLFEFFKKNPLFGRKMVRRVQKVDEETGSTVFSRETYYEVNYVETGIVAMTQKVAFDSFFEIDDDDHED